TFHKNTDMKKTDRPESKQTLSTIGLKSFLLVALLFALGFLLVNQSPLIVHRSSITQGLKVEFNNNNKIEDKIAARGPVEKNIDSKPSEIEVVEEKEAQPEVNPRLSIEKNRKNSPIPPVNKEDDITVPAIEDLLADGDIPANANARLGQSRGQESIEEAADSNARSETSSIKAIEYHLIVGSFKSLNTANKAVSTWKNQGYKAIVLFSPAGSSLTHRVSVFKSTNRGEVEKFANRLKAKGKKSTWIYEDRYQN
ncbi:MAG: SPOR domain-containing protein, partial [Bacteroidota bacterium]